MSWLAILCIWGLVAASILTTFHIRWVFKRHLELMERVHRLEMEQWFPGYRERQSLEEALEWREDHPPPDPPG